MILLGCQKRWFNLKLSWRQTHAAQYLLISNMLANAIAGWDCFTFGSCLDFAVHHLVNGNIITPNAHFEMFVTSFDLLLDRQWTKRQTLIWLQFVLDRLQWIFITWNMLLNENSFFFFFLFITQIHIPKMKHLLFIKLFDCARPSLKEYSYLSKHFRKAHQIYPGQQRYPNTWNAQNVQ